MEGGEEEEEEENWCMRESLYWMLCMGDWINYKGLVWLIMRNGHQKNVYWKDN